MYRRSQLGMVVSLLSSAPARPRPLECCLQAERGGSRTHQTLYALRRTTDPEVFVLTVFPFRPPQDYSTVTFPSVSSDWADREASEIIIGTYQYDHEALANSSGASLALATSARSYDLAGPRDVHWENTSWTARSCVSFEALDC